MSVSSWREAGLAGAMGLIAVLVIGAGVVANRPIPKESARPVIRLTPASLLTSDANQTDDTQSEIRPLPPTKIEVDTARKLSTDTDALRKLFAEGRVVVPHSQTLSIGTAPAEAETDWFVWGRLGGGQSDVTVTQAAALPSDSVRTYAAFTTEGSAVVVANRSSRKIPIRVQIRLPRGVYKCERLTFAPKAEVTTDTGLHPADDNGATLTATTETTLERLEGRELAGKGVILKTGVMEPGAVCVLRYTEQVREVALAWKETHRQLNALAATNSSSARRMRKMLNETGLDVNGLYAGDKNTSSRRLSKIYQLLLATAQAHSRQRNDLARRAVPSEVGGNLMGALERLSDSLSETSAVILGLVPRIKVERKPGAASTELTFAQETPEGDPTRPKSAGETVVTVALTNAGRQSVNLVKLGMDVTSLPSGVACDPTDPALFGALRPGQTAKAAFRLKGQAAATCPANRFVGDVSYFAPGSPAHLRPRSW